MYVSIDCEMGGIDKECSLLTASFILANDKFEVVDEFDLFLKPDDKIYRVNAEALNVNKINICDHDLCAIRYKEAATHLYGKFNDWWRLAKQLDNNFKRFKVCGFGVYGDLQWIFRCLLNENSWNNFFDYDALELGSVYTWAELTGFQPTLDNKSLVEIAKASKIEVDILQLHNANYDAKLVLACLREMLIYGVPNEC